MARFQRMRTCRERRVTPPAVPTAVARTWPRRRNERALRIRSFTTRCLVRSPLVWLESRRVPRLERPNRSTRRRQTGRQRTDTFTQRRGRTASTRSRRRGPLLSELIDASKTSTDAGTATLSGQLSEEQVARALKKK